MKNEIERIFSLFMVIVGVFLTLNGAAEGFSAETVKDLGFAVALTGTGLAVLILVSYVILLRRLNQMLSAMEAQENCCSAVEFILTPLFVEEESEDFCQSGE